MGYDLHITRQTHWADVENTDLHIPLNEWLEYVENDKELILNPTAYSYTKKGSNEKCYSMGFAEWTSQDGYISTWFDYSDGNIDTKNPEWDTINKMKQIAKALNATLMGDDGEIYDLNSDKVIRDWVDVWNFEEENKKPWWKFW